MPDEINVEEECTNTENGYTFRTPHDWGVVTGVLLLAKDKAVYREIDPESGFKWIEKAEITK